MSTINTVITSARPRRLFQSQMSTWRPVAISLAPGGRDLAAVVVFSAIGLLVSLLLGLFWAGGLSAFIAQAP
jgi:hypothetical protein